MPQPGACPIPAERPPGGWQARAARGRVLIVVGGAALVLQVASAACVVEQFASPNASTRIARHLAAQGELAIQTSGTAAPGSSPLGTLRAYQLPGEPLLQAAAFRWLPPSAWRYLHTPIAIVFVLGVALVGRTIAGERGALVAGLCAACDPFVIAHGPVWDDAFLAAALDWTLIALVLAQTGRGPAERGVRGLAPVLWFVLPALAGAAAVTRTASQMFLLLLGLALVGARPSRVTRQAGVAILAGCLIGVGGWGLRNTVVLGTFLTGSTHDGKTLFESVYRTARPEIRRTGVAQYYDPAEAPMLAEGVGLGEVALDRFYRKQAVRYIAAHPLDVSLTAAFKLAVSLTGVDLGRPWSSARNLGAVGFNMCLLVLAGWGWRRWWGAAEAESPHLRAARVVFAWAALILAVSAVALLALGPVGLRYRLSFSGLLYVGVAMLVMPRPRSPARAPPSPLRSADASG